MKGDKKRLPQVVESFDEVIPLETYKVEFHKNTRGLCYYGIEVEASTLEEMKEKLDKSISAVQDIIKKRGWKEVES